MDREEEILGLRGGKGRVSIRRAFRVGGSWEVTGIRDIAVFRIVLFILILKG